MLELRPARRDFWAALARRPVVQRRVLPARAGSLLAFLRDGARIFTASLRKLGGRLFSLQKRIETAFHASGAAAQLADAALAGEATPELAARIASIARALSGSAGAAVHLRSPFGVQLLGSDGADCEKALAERALASGKVEWGENAAAVPLRVGEEVVGSLSLQFDGRPRDLRSLRPLLSRAGAVLAAAEREARKDRFLSLAAHELKTPLTSIKGFSYSLARKLERGENFDPKHMHVLERQAERLHSLLEEMLEVSRIETGRFVLHQEPCQVGDLIEASVRSLKRLAPDVQVEVSLPSPLSLLADRDRVERALTAMIVRARALGSPVRVEALREGPRALLRVSWEGAPLSEAEQLAAFAARWELPQGQREGLGMALAVAREAAQLNGGALLAEPRAFVLELPLEAPDAEQARGPGSILVED